MLQSMTGFGRAQVSSEYADIQVEVKTLNAKQTDSYLKIPSFLYQKEIELKNLLSQQLERGKITLVVEFTPKNADDSLVKINEAMVANYYKQLKTVASQVGETESKDLLRVAMTLPDVLIKQDTPEALEERFSQLLPVLNEAILACTNFRKQEGEALCNDLEARIKNIQQYLEKVAEHDPNRTAKMKERLKAQMAEWENSDAYDANRFEQELIYYIEKLDITEEKVRLENHLNYFTETLNKEGEVQKGKKLGFISQEIGREINTIGSKANDATIQRLVVNMKDELEKIKEQTLNVL